MIPNGGTPVETRSGHDSGLSMVVAAVPADNGCPSGEGGGCATATVDLDVTDAVVAATSITTGGCPTGYLGIFWLQDDSSYIKVDLGNSCQSTDHLPAGLASVRVGDRVSFTATEVSSVFEIGVISGMSDWSVSDTEDDTVFVDRITDRALTLDDVSSLIYVEGTISAAGNACGKWCYPFTYSTGEGTTATIEYRSEAGRAVGSTFSYLGAVNRFGDTIQVTDVPNAGNYDWGSGAE